MPFVFQLINSSWSDGAVFNYFPSESFSIAMLFLHGAGKGDGEIFLKMPSRLKWNRNVILCVEAICWSTGVRVCVKDRRDESERSSVGIAKINNIDKIEEAVRGNIRKQRKVDRIMDRQ